VIYAGERVSTDLAEVNLVAKQLVAKYRWVAWVNGMGDGASLLAALAPVRAESSSLTSLPHAPLMPACPLIPTPALPSCSGVYKEAGFPHEVSSDLTCRKWQVNDNMIEYLAISAPIPADKLAVS
jgi:hypothetical protein